MIDEEKELDKDSKIFKLFSKRKSSQKKINSLHTEKKSKKEIHQESDFLAEPSEEYEKNPVLTSYSQQDECGQIRPSKKQEKLKKLKNSSVEAQKPDKEASSISGIAVGEEETNQSATSNTEIMISSKLQEKPQEPEDELIVCPQHNLPQIRVLYRYTLAPVHVAGGGWNSNAGLTSFSLPSRTELRSAGVPGNQFTAVRFWKRKKPITRLRYKVVKTRKKKFKSASSSQQVSSEKNAEDSKSPKKVVKSRRKNNPRLNPARALLRRRRDKGHQKAFLNTKSADNENDVLNAKDKNIECTSNCSGGNEDDHGTQIDLECRSRQNSVDDFHMDIQPQQTEAECLESDEENAKKESMNVFDAFETELTCFNSYLANIEKSFKKKIKRADAKLICPFTRIGVMVSSSEDEVEPINQGATTLPTVSQSHNLEEGTEEEPHQPRLRVIPFKTQADSVPGQPEANPLAALLAATEENRAQTLYDDSVERLALLDETVRPGLPPYSRLDWKKSIKGPVLRSRSKAAISIGLQEATAGAASFDYDWPLPGGSKASAAALKRERELRKEGVGLRLQRKLRQFNAQSLALTEIEEKMRHNRVRKGRPVASSGNTQGGMSASSTGTATFACPNCGKAGFKNEWAVRSHLWTHCVHNRRRTEKEYGPQQKDSNNTASTKEKGGTKRSHALQPSHLHTLSEDTSLAGSDMDSEVVRNERNYFSSHTPLTSGGSDWEGEAETDSVTGGVKHIPSHVRWGMSLTGKTALILADSRWKRVLIIAYSARSRRFLLEFPDHRQEWTHLNEDKVKAVEAPFPITNHHQRVRGPPVLRIQVVPRASAGQLAFIRDGPQGAKLYRDEDEIMNSVDTEHRDEVMNCQEENEGSASEDDIVNLLRRRLADKEDDAPDHYAETVFNAQEQENQNNKELEVLKEEPPTLESELVDFKTSGKMALFMHALVEKVTQSHMDNELAASEPASPLEDQENQNDEEHEVLQGEPPLESEREELEAAGKLALFFNALDNKVNQHHSEDELAASELAIPLEDQEPIEKECLDGEKHPKTQPDANKMEEQQELEVQKEENLEQHAQTEVQQFLNDENKLEDQTNNTKQEFIAENKSLKIDEQPERRFSSRVKSLSLSAQPLVKSVDTSVEKETEELPPGQSSVKSDDASPGQEADEIPVLEEDLNQSTDKNVANEKQTKRRSSKRVQQGHTPTEKSKDKALSSTEGKADDSLISSLAAKPSQSPPEELKDTPADSLKEEQPEDSVHAGKEEFEQADKNATEEKQAERQPSTKVKSHTPVDRQKEKNLDSSRESQLENAPNDDQELGSSLDSDSVTPKHDQKHRRAAKPTLESAPPTPKITTPTLQQDKDKSGNAKSDKSQGSAVTQCSPILPLDERTKCKFSRFSVGCVVEVDFKDKGTNCPSRVIKVNDRGYSILFDNDEIEDKVPSSNVRINESLFVCLSCGQRLASKLNLNSHSTRGCPTKLGKYLNNYNAKKVQLNRRDSAKCGQCRKEMESPKNALVCNGCNSVFHNDCRLFVKTPKGGWFCISCVPPASQKPKPKTTDACKGKKREGDDEKNSSERNLSKKTRLVQK